MQDVKAKASLSISAQRCCFTFRATKQYLVMKKAKTSLTISGISLLLKTSFLFFMHITSNSKGDML